MRSSFYDGWVFVRYLQEDILPVIILYTKSASVVKGRFRAARTGLIEPAHSPFPLLSRKPFFKNVNFLSILPSAATFAAKRLYRSRIFL